ncbi:MAG: hypothetical protein JXB88_19620 [Spirochaetales bacterium]|nr:hypothetical protein [Spirochaetales bacterium]
MIKGTLTLVVSLCLMLSTVCFLDASAQDNPETKNIYIGIYLTDISGFDLTDGRFQADFNLWCKWFGKDDIPPILFSNGELDTMEIIDREDEGNWHSIRWHIQGTFRGTFPLQNFPFDTQTLTLEIGLEGSYGNPRPDLAGSGMSKSFSITGWVYAPYFKATTTTRTYASDFGSIAKEGKPFDVRSVSFSVLLKRPMAPYIIKFLLPLIFIILISMAVFFISPDQLEANIGVGVTTLLTCVAFQFSLSDSIPDVPYLVTADKFFIIAYCIVFINIIETIVTFNVDKKNPALSAKIDKYSWRILGGALIFFISLIFFLDVIIPGYIPIKPVSQKTYAEQPVSSKKELVMSVASLKTLNVSNIKQGLIYRGLFYEVKGGRKEPHLVEEVPSFTNEFIRFLPDGGVVVTWKLKPGMKWGDGKSVTTDDLLFSLEITGKTGVRDVWKIDMQTIEIEYAKRTGSVVDGFVIYPKHHFKEVYEKEGIDGVYDKIKTDPPPMDGPYILESFVSGDRASFVFNPYFTGKKPAIERITIIQIKKPLPDAAIAGETDLCSNLGVSSYNQVAGKAGLATREDPVNNLYLLQPDVHIFPYNQQDFRKALIHAIDRDKVRRLLFDDKGEIAHSYRQENAPDYNPGIEKYDYNPAKAKNLLASLKLKDPVKLIISKALRNSPEYVVVEAILADLQKAGLKVNLEISETATSYLYSSGDHGGIVYINRSSDFSFPVRFWNIPYLEDERKPTEIFTPEVLALENYFNNTMFIERKYALSWQLQELFSKSLPVIPLSFGVYRSVFNEKLKGWDPRAVEDNIWWNVEYWYFE